MTDEEKTFGTSKNVKELVSTISMEILKMCESTCNSNLKESKCHM